MPISQSDIKLLWGRAASHCSICRTELSHDTRQTETPFPIGEQAHIVAKESSGTRGNSSLTAEERDSYSNLILLCPTCHTIIDKNEDDYPRERLYIIKANHELWVQQTLDRSKTLSAPARPVTDLFFFIEDVKPLFRWIYKPVPVDQASHFFTSLQHFWSAYNLFTEHIDEDLRYGIEHLLRPLTDEHLTPWKNAPYSQGKMGRGRRYLSDYVNKIQHEWREVSVANPITGILLEIRYSLEDSIAIGNITELQREIFRHIIYIVTYYEHSQRIKGYSSISERMVTQFLYILNPFFEERFGFTIPDALDARAMDHFDQIFQMNDNA